MRKYITTIILTAVFLGLLVFFYFYEAKKEDKTDEDDYLNKTFAVWDINRDEIKELNIKYEDKEFVINKEGDGTWKASRPREFKANTEKINSILDEYKNIEGKGEEISAENLVEYGLDKPKGTVKFKFSDESTKEIIFGDESIDELNIYTKVSDKDFIFLADKFLFDKIKITEEDLSSSAEVTEDKKEENGEKKEEE